MARSSASPGLLGAGRTEVCEAIFGAGPIQSGSILVDGRELRPRSPSDSMAAGISMLPEDRKESGLFMDFTITANVVAANLPAYTHSGLLSRPRCARSAEHYVDDLRIATPSVDREVRYLSGGNQQKVLLAKWLARQPRILIVDEPTRGVDVGSKADIYRILRDLAAQRHGAAGRLLRPARGPGAGAPHRGHVGGPRGRRAGCRDCHRDRHSRARRPERPRP